MTERVTLYSGMLFRTTVCSLGMAFLLDSKEQLSSVLASHSIPTEYSGEPRGILYLAALYPFT